MPGLLSAFRLVLGLASLVASMGIAALAAGAVLYVSRLISGE